MIAPLNENPGTYSEKDTKFEPLADFRIVNDTNNSHKNPESFQDPGRKAFSKGFCA